ncbi:MAG: hypothetical protein NTV86_01205 [Planctomycetota bacterium]|nr:hypothetical protein [Planctomycetota bacterium]
MNAWRTFSTVALLAAPFCPAPAQALTFTDPSGGYTLEIPEGFRPISQERLAKKWACLYGRRAGDSPESSFLLGIERLDFLLPEGQALSAGKPESAPSSSVQALSMDAGSGRWNGFEIQVLKERARYPNGTTLVGFTAHVPLKPHAIAVRATGPESAEDQVRLLLDNALSSLTGQTNWTQTPATYPRRVRFPSASDADAASPAKGARPGQHDGGIPDFDNVSFGSTILLAVGILAVKASRRIGLWLSLALLGAGGLILFLERPHLGQGAWLLGAGLAGLVILFWRGRAHPAAPPVDKPQAPPA